MTESYFVFDGKSSLDFDLHIEKIPVIKMPERKRTKVSVPGRNGDLHIDDGSFENYIQPYECYFHGNCSATELAHAIKGWLASSGAYRRLEDSYDPQCFRMATFTGPMDIANILYEYGRCKINFDCAPQSFLKSGEQQITIASPTTLSNPTGFCAAPIIVVYGTGSGTITVGGRTVKVKTITDQIVLDCELQHAYRQVGEGAPENKNGCIYAPEFPVLSPGDNLLSWSGGITHLEIIPRWWTL